MSGVIDDAVLAELESVVGADIVAELITSYESDAKLLSEKLHGAFAAGDVKGVLAASHTLKSTSETLGARGLGKICGDIEALARGGSLCTPEQISAFDVELAAVLAEYQRRPAP